MKHFLKLWYGVRCIPCLLLFCISACCGKGSSVDALSVTDLKCRNLVNPEGIDFAAMSWKIDTKAQNVTQSAWEIEIASSEKALRRGKADLWCSQPQTSDRQFDIRPEGVTFTPGVKYWWRVRVWDEQQRASAWSDPAFFSIGLSNEQWQAQWITSTWSDQSP
ncbi:MAG: hypothetical protein PHV49_05425, partial [Alistipes sp.]|nr:hypothetical protein [Alistipes sp.]